MVAPRVIQARSVACPQMATAQRPRVAAASRTSTDEHIACLRNAYDIARARCCYVCPAFLTLRVAGWMRVRIRLRNAPDIRSVDNASHVLPRGRIRLRLPQHQRSRHRVPAECLPSAAAKGTEIADETAWVNDSRPLALLPAQPRHGRCGQSLPARRLILMSSITSRTPRAALDDHAARGACAAASSARHLAVRTT